jgi:hypothetical protein
MGKMRRIMTGAAALIAWAALLTGTGAAAQTVTGGGWGKPAEIAGALNTGGIAGVLSVSCPSAGNCTAGGYYLNRSSGEQAFAVSQTDGTWGTVTTLNVGGNGTVDSLSCPSAGNCTAGGSYTSSSSDGLALAFVISETNGTWGTATKVAGEDAAVVSVSCPSAGNCSAGGYNNSLNASVAFVVNEKHGIWGKIKEVHLGAISSLSCPSAGNCSAGGGFALFGQAFTVDETNGTWGPAQEIAGAHSPGEFAGIESVSCPSAGNCSAAGYYESRHYDRPDQLFAVSETNGVWGTASQLLAGRNTSQFARVESVSCPSAGNCSAIGYYTASSGTPLAFAVSQTNGTWGTPDTISASPAATSTSLLTVSCASAGNCSAGGDYFTGTEPYQAFAVSQTNGTWGKAQKIAGSLNIGRQAEIDSMSCVPPGYCTAGGSYDNQGHEAFAVSKP